MAQPGIDAGDKRHIVIILAPSITTDSGARGEFVPLEVVGGSPTVPTQPWSNVEGFVAPAEPDPDTNPIFGGPLWRNALRRWAAIEHMSGSNLYTAEQVDGERVVVHIRTDFVRGLTTEMRVRHLIEFDGDVPRYVDYMITNIADIDEMRRQHVISCLRIHEAAIE